MDLPLDKSADKIISNASSISTNHLLGIKIEYKCQEGYFYDDDQSTEKYATCDPTNGNFTYPTPFGQCVQSKTCTNKPPGTDLVNDIGQAVGLGAFSHDYDSSKTYKNDDVVT